jgi:hypothetical protein
MIIGVLGKKRSGKDTISDYLINKYNFTKYGMAHPLKDALMHIFGWSYDQVYNNAKDSIDPNWGVSPREVMQLIGTEVFQYYLPEKLEPLQKFGRSFWVNRFEIWRKENRRKNVIISDVRFQHEVDRINELGGVIWRVTRPSADGVLDLHPSEKEMDEVKGVKCIIENNGTIDELYKKIDRQLFLSAQI